MTVEDFIELNMNGEMEFNICSDYKEEVDEYINVIENISLDELSKKIKKSEVTGWFLEENQSISIEIE